MPVTGVTLKDSAAYAKWAKKRLPTEAEWEIAASWDGKNKRLFPWGAQHVQGNANIASGELSDVGTYKKDNSPWGAYDMAGNVAEWTATSSGEEQIVRGSSAEKTATSDSARTTRRSFLPTDTASSYLGFRCAKDVE